MGRLFWKFFLCILLAQVAATIGIGGTIWLRDQTRDRSGDATLDVGPPGTIMLDAARATLKHAGLTGLRELALNSRRMRLYILDEQGHELLGRPVPAKLREEVTRNLAMDADDQQRPVARLTGPDGRNYIAFASRIPRSAPDAILQDATRIEASAGALAVLGGDPRGERNPGQRMGPASGPGQNFFFFFFFFCNNLN